MKTRGDLMRESEIARRLAPPDARDFCGAKWPRIRYAPGWVYALAVIAVAALIWRMGG